MSTDPIEDELDAPLLLYRLAAIDLDDQKAVDFLLTTHPIEGRKLVEGTTASSVGFDDLFSRSGGLHPIQVASRGRLPRYRGYRC